MDTVKAARTNLAEQTRETVEQTIGGDSATGQAIIHRLEDGVSGNGA